MALTNPPGTAGGTATGGSGFVARGTYAANTTYAVDDIVQHGSPTATYRVKTAHTTTTTLDTLNLELWAQSGADGPQGPAGPSGVASGTAHNAVLGANVTAGTTVADVLSIAIPAGGQWTVTATADIDDSATGVFVGKLRVGATVQTGQVIKYGGGRTSHSHSWVVTIPDGGATVYFSAETTAGTAVIYASNTQLVAAPVGAGPVGATGATGAAGANGRGFTPRGAYAPSTSYQIDDIVTFMEATYRVHTAHTTAATLSGDANLEKWAAKGDPGANGTNGTNGRGFTPRGAYAASTAYSVDDLVQHGGETFRVTTAHTTTATLDTANLEKWAAKGADGSASGGSTLNNRLQRSAGATLGTGAISVFDLFTLPAGKYIINGTFQLSEVTSGALVIIELFAGATAQMGQIVDGIIPRHNAFGSWFVELTADTSMKFEAKTNTGTAKLWELHTKAEVIKVG